MQCLGQSIDLVTNVSDENPFCTLFEMSAFVRQSRTFDSINAIFSFAWLISHAQMFFFLNWFESDLDPTRLQM